MTYGNYGRPSPPRPDYNNNQPMRQPPVWKLVFGAALVIATVIGIPLGVLIYGIH